MLDKPVFALHYCKENKYIFGQTKNSLFKYFDVHVGHI